MILVNLALATICFAGHCYPALVGPKTPVGEFSLTHMWSADPLYGGDVLVFNDLGPSVQSIHRTWLGQPREHRAERLRSDDPRQRQSITNGCINVEPEVFEALRDCCSNQQLKVVRR